MTLLLGPQFPIWVPVSPKEDRARMDPDTSFKDISRASESDGEARGVFVDFALVMPIVQPRNLEEFGDEFVKTLTVKEKSLRANYVDFVRQDVVKCFWVSGFEAPVLQELKPGHPRHPKDANRYLTSLRKTLIEGQDQAEEQALCLFSSWRFASQNEVVLIAGAGWYYCVKVVTRDWAVRKLKGHTYSAVKIKNIKERREQEDMDRIEQEEQDDLGIDREGDSDDGKKEEDTMYGNPRGMPLRDKRQPEAFGKVGKVHAKACYAPRNSTERAQLH
jgi:hypothetical protein